MKVRLLTAVSAIAVMLAMPALAGMQVNADASAKTGISADVQKGWKNTKDAVSTAAKDAADATSNAYTSIKATLINNNSSGPTVNIDSRMTASGMIGQPVYNAKNEKIATIHDIILDEKGQAKMVVLADGGLFGLGSKYAAFDYDLVSQRQKDGDMIMPITQETIDKVAAFSYDRKDSSDKVRVIPENGISVAALLNSQVVDPTDKSVAKVDNIAFRDGAANQVVVAFDQVLGMGGKKAVLNYNDVNVERKGNDSFDLKLSANQAAQFEDYKKTATN